MLSIGVTFWHALCLFLVTTSYVPTDGFLLIAALAVYYGAIGDFFGREKAVIDEWSFGALGS